MGEVLFRAENPGTVLHGTGEPGESSNHSPPSGGTPLG